jgi:hypothetical protein
MALLLRFNLLIGVSTAEQLRQAWEYYPRQITDRCLSKWVNFLVNDLLRFVNPFSVWLRRVNQTKVLF